MRTTMSRYGGLLVRLALMVLIVWGSNLWLVRIRDSIHNHRSVLRGQPSLNEPGSPLVQQVVLIVVGGLRYDVSLHMPYLNSLRDRGFEAPSRGYFPSHSQTAWTTLISGAGPEINDAPLVNLPDDELRFVTVDDLFAEAKRSQLTTALAGFGWWKGMIPDRFLDASFFVSAADAQADQQLVDAAVGIMDSLRPNFLLVHLSQVDHAAQASGAGSREYRAAVRRADSHIREIAQRVSLSRNVLIVASDHGYLADGGHGGGDEEVVVTPLVMAGGPVAPGSYEEIDQADLAPTIAALLGLAVPSAAQGEILFEACALPEAELTSMWVSWAQQRVGLGDLYLESIRGRPLSESARGDAEIAHSSMLVRNYGSARNLAEFAVRETDEEMRRGRARRISREQQRRLPIGLLVIGLGTYMLWRRWSRTTAALIVSALASILIYNLLFVWGGHVYSFSTMAEWDVFLAETTTRMTVAIIPAVCIITWIMWRKQEARPVDIAVTNYSFTLILAFFLSLPLIVGYVANGVEITWYLPDPLLAFLQVSALGQLAVAGFLGFLVPLVTIPFDRLLRWIRVRVRSTAASRA